MYVFVRRCESPPQNGAKKQRPQHSPLSPTSSKRSSSFFSASTTSFSKQETRERLQAKSVRDALKREFALGKSRGKWRENGGKRHEPRVGKVGVQDNQLQPSPGRSFSTRIPLSSQVSMDCSNEPEFPCAPLRGKRRGQRCSV